MTLSPHKLSPRKQKTRRRLMDAAVQLIRQKGFDDITVIEIAETAEYGQWTFYQYFSNKEDIIFQIFEEFMTKNGDMAIEMIQQYDSPVREYYGWKMLFRMFDNNRDFFTNLDSPFLTNFRPRVKEFLIKRVSKNLREGKLSFLSEADPDVVARLHIAAVLELMHYWLDHPDITVDTLVDQFFMFMFHQPPPNQD